MKMRYTILTAIAVFVMTFSAMAQNLQPKEGFTIHTVQWFEDMQNISAKYGVPEDIIIKVNNLKDFKLFTRQQIYIPISEKYWPGAEASEKKEPVVEPEPVVVEPEPVKEPKEPVMVEPEPVMVEPEPEPVMVEPEPEPVVVEPEPVILPVTEEFATSEYPEVDVDILYPVAEPESKSEITFALVLPFSAKHEAERGNCLDFYSGVLMATKRLAEEGISINLNVHDTKDENYIQQENNDFILGPIKSDDIANILWRVGWIPVVSPLDQKAENLAISHRNLVQAPSPLAAQYEDAVNWACSIAGDKPDNFIIISSPADTMSLRLARTSLDNAGKHYSICNCSVQGEVSGWDRAFNPGARNIVFLAATGEAILNNALRNMVIESTKGDILTFAVSKIRSYDTIPVENLHLANAHITCPYYVDYKDRDTHNFIRTYRALYKTEPSQYAFQGYDLTYFMAKSYSSLGRGWSGYADTLPKMEMLQATFRLQRTESGSLLNHGMRRLEYTKDYKVESVK